MPDEIARAIRKWAREERGAAVREAWIAWAGEQPDPKPSWLVPWAGLDAGQREADMRIGDAVMAPVLGLLAAIRGALAVSYTEPDHASLLRERAAVVRGVIDSIVRSTDMEGAMVILRRECGLPGEDGADER